MRAWAGGGDRGTGVNQLPEHRLEILVQIDADLMCDHEEQAAAEDEQDGGKGSDVPRREPEPETVQRVQA